MNTAKVYHDSDGEEMTIHQMVKHEPMWAANRIQVGEKAISDNKVYKELISTLSLMLNISPEELADLKELCGMTLQEKIEKIKNDGAERRK